MYIKTVCYNVGEGSEEQDGSDCMQEIARGDVYMTHFSGCGSVQGGLRPAVVLQNNTGNKFAPTVIVAPMTSKMSKHHMPTHVVIPSGHAGLSVCSMVLAEQIQTVDKTQLGRKLGRLYDREMEAVNQAVKISVSV